MLARAWEKKMLRALANEAELGIESFDFQVILPCRVVSSSIEWPDPMRLANTQVGMPLSITSKENEIQQLNLRGHA